MSRKEGTILIKAIAKDSFMPCYGAAAKAAADKEKPRQKQQGGIKGTIGGSEEHAPCEKPYFMRLSAPPKFSRLIKM